MRREPIVRTRSLAGASDLTLFAPIKVGLVPSLESVTYKTRVKRLLRTLTSLRTSSHESALLRPFSDAVERVGRIHSVRVAVIEPEDKVLLAVTFDGAWESYIRVLWQKVGGLLDVIFSNTEGYVSACDHSFEEYLAWARRIQTESAFFYAVPHTVDDVQYLRKEELLQRMTDEALEATFKTIDRTLLGLRSSVQTAEMIAAGQRTAHTVPEALFQGLQALGGFYRLADLYLPNQPDGRHLQRAASELLVEFRALFKSLPDEQREALRRPFDRQFDWLDAVDKIPSLRPIPPLEPPQHTKENVQGGIVTGYEHVTHGCLLMMAFDTPEAGSRFIERLLPLVSHDGVQPSEGKPVVNVALTYEGLRALGLSDAQQQYFPQDFREGMEARASVLGDLRTNHPRRWRLPRRVRADNTEVGAQIELSTVHIVVQLRGSSPVDVDDPLDPSHPLHELVARIEAFEPKAYLLAVQPMRRRLENDCGKERIREHFGFLDGDGQPLLGPQPDAKYYKNGIHLGEVLLGYASEADPAPLPANDPAGRERQELLFDGSFLVMRKLRQDVAGLHAKADKAANEHHIDKKTVLAKMMGRDVDGNPLVTNVTPGTKNDFDYQSDTQGSQCPFHSHIRRANPRAPRAPFEPFGGRTPRIMRRGMSYGPRYDHSNPQNPVNAQERGLMFMAYNTSIEEQFEVVQRWLAGGNSGGGLSSHSDPLLGVPEVGHQRFYRFENAGKAVRMELDGSATLMADPQPFVRLEWGMYLFAPSLRALAKLKDIAAQAGAPEAVWSVEDGERQIMALQAIGDEQRAIAQWKSVLEDPDAQESFVSASVWAAIREKHGGALRTPYGVLVADRKLVMHVLTDTKGHYSANGYHRRMARSIGEIYLGLDRPPQGGAYDVESKATNEAIQKLGEAQTFALTLQIASGALKKAIDAQKQRALEQGDKQWQLMLDVKDLSDAVLWKLSQFWFGIQDDGPFTMGSSRWDWPETQASFPLCPGNFTAPSRYIFQPRPGATAEEYGGLYGRTLTAAMEKFIDPFRRAGTVPLGPTQSPAPITAGILADKTLSVTQVARHIIGAMMGFLPTVDGNLRRSLNEWLNDQTFWRLRSRWAMTEGDAYAKANELLRMPLMQSMQLRPTPELVWRTATQHHDLGCVAVEPGDLIVVSIVSATQQCLQHQVADVFPIFGGDRSAKVHPTHACPGYAASMGVLLGIVSALFEVTDVMRPTPAPLVLALGGPLSPPMRKR